MIFTLSINGAAAVNLETLGLSFQSLDLSNMQVDTVTLSWARPGPEEMCPCAEGDDVELFVDGRRIFVGRIRMGAVRWDSVSLSIRGPWSHLDEFIYQEEPDGGWDILRLGDVIIQEMEEGSEYWDGTSFQPYTDDITWTVAYESFYDPATDPYSGTIGVNNTATARMYLFDSVSGELPISPMLQMTELFLYLDHIQDYPFLTVGDLEWGTPFRAKHRTIQDMALSEAMRQTLSCIPDAAIWFEYEGDLGDVPVLRGRIARLETPMTLVVGEQVLTDYSITPVEDLRAAGVVIRQEINASPATGKGQIFQLRYWPPETASYERRVLIHTITEESGDLAVDLAKSLHESLDVPRARGSLTVLDPDFSLGLRPGMTINIEGDGMLEGYQIWVQTVKWNPADGLATLTVGYPDHLSVRELADLRQLLRRGFYPPGVGTRQLTMTGDLYYG